MPVTFPFGPRFVWFLCADLKQKGLSLRSALDKSTTYSQISCAAYVQSPEIVTSATALGMAEFVILRNHLDAEALRAGAVGFGW